MTEPAAARTPKVSVLMITYNHEKYIEQAVRSVMMQETDFDYELIIGEDCSTDSTREIVLRLLEEFPEKIRLLLPEKNLGMIPNFIATYEACDGEYVAILEGDDYWIDNHKLEKQVCFLDANPEYVLLGSNALVLNQALCRLTGVVSDIAESFDFDTRYLMLKNPLPTLTVMFRNRLILDFPPIFRFGDVGDKRLYLLLSEHGSCRYEAIVTGVYRRHPTSVTSKRDGNYASRKGALKERILLSDEWNAYYQNRFNTEVSELKQQSARRLVALALRHSDLRTAITYSRYLDPRDFRSIRSKFMVHGLRMVAGIQDHFGFGARHVA